VTLISEIVEIEAWFQRTTNREWPLGNRMVTLLICYWYFCRFVKSRRGLADSRPTMRQSASTLET